MTFDIRKICLAYSMAEKAHEGQKRKYTGAPYLEHPCRVAERVMTLPGATTDMVAAALLHDTLEDTALTAAEIAGAFGPDVLRIVLELTHTFKHEHPELNRAGRKALDHNRLAGASREAKFIKMIDRLDNLRDMSVKEDAKFAALYAAESRDLTMTVRNVDTLLYAELLAEIDRIDVAVKEVV